MYKLLTTTLLSTSILINNVIASEEFNIKANGMNFVSIKTKSVDEMGFGMGAGIGYRKTLENNFWYGVDLDYVGIRNPQISNQINTVQVSLKSGVLKDNIRYYGIVGLDYHNSSFAEGKGLLYGLGITIMTNRFLKMDLEFTKSDIETNNEMNDYSTQRLGGSFYISF